MTTGCGAKLGDGDTGGLTTGADRSTIRVTTCGGGAGATDVDGGKAGDKPIGLST